MSKLRKRQIAKQYGIKFKVRRRRHTTFWLFTNSEGGIGFHNGNDATFLNVVKNQEKWHNPFFELRAK